MAEQELLPKKDSEFVASVLARRERAMADNRVWWNLLRSVYYYTQPNRNVFLQQEAPGSQRDSEVYDLTGVLNTRNFVNKMQNSLVPQNINWMQFEPGTDVQREIKAGLYEEDQVNELNKLLDAHTDLFFSYLNDSNFYTVINEFLYDLAVGTATLQCNETDDDEQPFVFTCTPQDKIGFEEGVYGSISGVFLDFNNLRIAVAKQMFGDEFRVPPQFRSRNAYKPEEDKISLYMCSYYRYEKKDYHTVVIDKDSSEIVYEKEDESWEFITARWYKLPGETRGRGPALDATPGLATINLAFRDELAASELQSHPIYMGFDDGVFNPYTFQLRPNTILPVEAPGDNGMWPLQPLPAAGNIQYSAIVINDIREQIGKLMFANPLGPIQDAPPLTATEVAIRQKDMIEEAAASFQRLQMELFKPLIKRVLYILQKKGKMGDVKLDEKIISLKFRTPLSLGKGQIDVNQFMQFWGNLVSVVGEEAAGQIVEVTKVPYWMAKNMNVFLDILKPQKQLEAAEQQGKEALATAVNEGIEDV